MNSSSWSLIWWLRRVDPGDHRVAFVVKESAVPASLLETAAAPAVATSPVRTPKRAGLWSLPDVRWAALATALFAVGLIAHFAHAPSALAWSFFLASYAAGGWEPGLAGLQALREKTLDVDLLMGRHGVLVKSAVVMEQFGATTRVAFDKTGTLTEGTPRLAEIRILPGTESVVDAAGLQIGDVILVRPGERIGADGQVLSGSSDVDQATITGEPLPVAKNSGDEVFAGTLNGSGALRVRVERAASDTVVARIVAMVEEASATKARTQLFIEKVEQRYSIGMVTATLLLFAIPLLAGAAFQPTLLRAMTFMIVASDATASWSSPPS